MLKRGDFVLMTFNGQDKRAKVLLASPNGKSLMLGFEGVLYTSDGGGFFGSMPVLQDDAGTYRDLANEEVVTIEPKTLTH
jgi:hypothetical protein